MKDYFEKKIRNIKFGRDTIKITTFYLWRNKAGLRVEIKRFTKTQTVEIELLLGNDITTLKHIYKTKVLKKPTKNQIDQTVEEFIEIAYDLGLLHK